MTPLTTPAETAASEFRRRRASWQQVVQRGGSRRDAEGNLRLWLAIAAAAGCGEGRDGVPEFHRLRGVAIYPVGAEPPPLLACEIADRADWQAELLRARDVALAAALRAQAAEGGSADNTANPDNSDRAHRAWSLLTLATHLGCPAHAEPIAEREAA